MEFLVGITLAMLVCGVAAAFGMDRDRVFYPAVLIATASYYVAFAVVDGTRAALIHEAVIATVFVALAVVGFRRSPWVVVGALVGHGVMDVFHEALVHNAGVPHAWPGFCLAFDVTAAVLVGWVLVVRRSKRNVRPAPAAGHASPAPDAAVPWSVSGRWPSF